MLLKQTNCGLQHPFADQISDEDLFISKTWINFVLTKRYILNCSVCTLNLQSDRVSRITKFALNRIVFMYVQLL